MSVGNVNHLALVEHLNKQGTAPGTSLVKAAGFTSKVRVPGVLVSVFKAKATHEYVISTGDTLYFFHKKPNDVWLVSMLTVSERTNHNNLNLVFDKIPWAYNSRGISLVCVTDLVRAGNLQDLVHSILSGSIEQGGLISYPGYRTTNLNATDFKALSSELQKLPEAKLLNDIHKVISNHQ